MTAVQLADIDDDVKRWIPELIGKNEQDDLLEILIAAFSGEARIGILSGAEGACDRIFSTAQYTEYFSSDGLRTRLPVLAYPITAVAGLWIDSDQVFGANTLQPTTQYFADLKNGPWIHSRYSVFQSGRQHIKLTYTGGLATRTSQVPAALRLACSLQVSYWFHNRDKLGIQSMGQGGGSFSKFSDPAEYLPEVKQFLFPFLRMVG
jgi:hypothetical protein